MKSKDNNNNSNKGVVLFLVTVLLLTLLSFAGIFYLVKWNVEQKSYDDNDTYTIDAGYIPYIYQHYGNKFPWFLFEIE